MTNLKMGNFESCSWAMCHSPHIISEIIFVCCDWKYPRLATFLCGNSIYFSDVIGQRNIKAVSMIWKYLDLIMRTDRLCYTLNENEKFQICSNLCPLCGGQEVIVLHWDNLSDCYRRPRDRGMFDANGLFVFQRFSPADRAGLEKMDYVWTVNNNEVITGKYL